jgi:hypothetical protein
MLSSVLNSDRAIAVNIEIMRSFVRIRGVLEVDKFLARKFDRLERKFASHDQAIVGILAAIRQLMNPPEPKRRGIGFTADFEGVTDTRKAQVNCASVPESAIVQCDPIVSTTVAGSRTARLLPHFETCIACCCDMRGSGLSDRGYPLRSCKIYAAGSPGADRLPRAY